MSRDGSKTRTKILQSTLKLLEDSHGKGVRMTDIARYAGITRQALYLHFATRAELLIETTRYLDDLKGIEARLAPSRQAKTGLERLDAFVEAWGNYIPEIYGAASAIIAMSDTDEAAASAWHERMADMREGCAAAVSALHHDNMLSTDHPLDQATDILWMMLSVPTWEQLTLDSKWSQTKYVETIKSMAHRILVKP